MSTFGNRPEFKRNCITLLNDFCIDPKPTKINNSKSNANVERIYQVVGDMLRAHD